MKHRVLILVGAIALLLSTVATVHAQTATLAWDRNAEPDVTSYTLFYGSTTSQYTNQINVGNVTQYTVVGLDLSLNYFFAVRANASSGLSSALSAEVQLPAAVPPGTTVITAFTPNAGYPLLVGKRVTWTVTASSTRGPVEYKFIMFDPIAGWRVTQNFSQNPNFTWTPGWNDLGNHGLQVWARTVGSPAEYEAWVATNPFDVNASPVQITADVDFPTPPGNPVHWTAAIAGGTGEPLEYKFLVLNKGTGVWSIARDYATSNLATWTPAALGNYSIQVWARRVGSTAAYEDWGATGTLNVSRTTPQVTSLRTDVSLPASTGTAITLTARVKGGTTGPLQYQFIRYSAASGWLIVKDYSTSNTYTWTPAWGEEGQYSVQVWVRNGGSTAVYNAWLGTNMFDIQRAPLAVTVNRVSPVPPGTAVSIAAQVPDASATFEYQFFLYNRGTGTWSSVRDYGTASTFSWTPTAAGAYLIQVWARKVGSAAAYDVFATTGYMTVSVGPAQVVSLTSSVALPVSSGTPITWTAVANGGTASPLQYSFFLYTEGVGWTLLRDWATQNWITWTPSDADIGNHVVQVWVRSAGSTAPLEGWLGTPHFIIQP